MKTSQNTILITGGGSGIGFETAKLFSENGSTVIITGRNEDKLKKAVTKLTNAHYIVADVTKEKDVNELVKKIKSEFPNLNILMNNAGQAAIHRLGESENAPTHAREEMETNYLAAVNLTTLLLPLLKNASEAAVINVSSILGFVPSLSLPTYSASKAALHSYSQILRLSLANSNVKVFEVMPPLVDTEFAKDIPSDSKIAPAEVAEDLLRSMQANNYEVRVASTEQLYKNFLGSPDKAVLALNRIAVN